MTPAGDDAAWRARWRKSALEGMRETKVFLTQPAYLRASAIAEGQSERLPVTLGHLIEFAVATIEGDKAPVMKTRPRNASSAQIDLGDLTRAILASRFPEDTGAARFRQLAFVHLVAAETMRGERPTSTSLATISGSHKSQMDLLAKVLVERGVIVKTHAPGLKGAAAAKTLALAADAVRALKKAHIAVTGAVISI